jgi:hypothetical protein
MHAQTFAAFDEYFVATLIPLPSGAAVTETAIINDAVTTRPTIDEEYQPNIGAVT